MRDVDENTVSHCFLEEVAVKTELAVEQRMEANSSSDTTSQGTEECHLKSAGRPVQDDLALLSQLSSINTIVSDSYAIISAY